MTPSCPKCGHRWTGRQAVSLEDVGERIAAFGSCSHLVRRFLAQADKVRKTGLSESKALALLDDFEGMFREDAGAFGYALDATLRSEKFAWERQNLTAYVKTLCDDAKKRRARINTRPADTALEVAQELARVWHRLDGPVDAQRFADLKHTKECARVARAIKSVRERRPDTFLSFSTPAVGPLRDFVKSILEGKK